MEPDWTRWNGRVRDLKLADRTQQAARKQWQRLKKQEKYPDIVPIKNVPSQTVTSSSTSQHISQQKQEHEFPSILAGPIPQDPIQFFGEQDDSSSPSSLGSWNQPSTSEPKWRAHSQLRGEHTGQYSRSTSIQILPQFPLPPEYPPNVSDCAELPSWSSSPRSCSPSYTYEDPNFSPESLAFGQGNPGPYDQVYEPEKRLSYLRSLGRFEVKSRREEKMKDGHVKSFGRLSVLEEKT